MKLTLETIDDAELIAISEEVLSWGNDLLSMTIRGIEVTQTSVLKEMTRRFEERMK